MELTGTVARIVYNTRMVAPKRLHLYLSLALLVLSGFLLGWGFWPQASGTHTLALRAQDLLLPTADPLGTPSPTPDVESGSASGQPVEPTPSPETAQPALKEARRLILEYPAEIRQGDSASIRLSLQIDDVGTAVPSAGYSGEALMITDVYETHRVMAQARLDLAGIEAVPEVGQSQLQALAPGEEISFYWSIRSDQIAHYSGVVWFSLLYQPLDGGPEREQVISAQSIEIECVNFAGLGGTPARLMGGAGILLGVLLSMDTTADFLKKYRNSRKRRTGATRKQSSAKRSGRKARSR